MKGGVLNQIINQCRYQELLDQDERMLAWGKHRKWLPLKVAKVVKAVVLSRLLLSASVMGAMRGWISRNEKHVKEVAAQMPMTAHKK